MHVLHPCFCDDDRVRRFIGARAPPVPHDPTVHGTINRAAIVVRVVRWAHHRGEHDQEGVSMSCSNKAGFRMGTFWLFYRSHGSESSDVSWSLGNDVRRNSPDPMKYIRSWASEASTQNGNVPDGRATHQSHTIPADLPSRQAYSTRLLGPKPRFYRRRAHSLLSAISHKGYLMIKEVLGG